MKLDNPYFKKIRKIWKSEELDCDWLSNDELPHQSTFPDRSDRSGGCARRRRGRWASGTRGTGRSRERPGADLFRIFSPVDGGNVRSSESRYGDRGRGASTSPRQAGDRLSSGWHHGKDAIRSGDRTWRPPRSFHGIRPIGLAALPGSGDSAPLKPPHGAIGESQGRDRRSGGIGGGPGLFRCRSRILACRGGCAWLGG